MFLGEVDSDVFVGSRTPRCGSSLRAPALISVERRPRVCRGASRVWVRIILRAIATPDCWFSIADCWL